MSNDISFKMKVNIVDAAAFDKIKGGVNIDWKPPHKIISKYKEWADLGLSSLIKRQDFVVADEFRTTNVRTCFGFGTMNKECCISNGGHYLDDKENYKNILDYIKLIFKSNPNPDSAFAIGGKNLLNNEYSLPNMNFFLDIFKLKIPNLTCFCEHKLPYSETDFHYSLKDDVLTICTTYNTQPTANEYNISTPEEINMCYRKVHLADGDELYINGKEVDAKQFKTDNI